MVDDTGAVPNVGPTPPHADAEIDRAANLGVDGDRRPSMAFSQRSAPPLEPEPEDVDPLVNLIDRVRADGRLVFGTRVLDALCVLEDSDPGRFTQLHWQLIRECD